MGSSSFFFSLGRSLGKYFLEVRSKSKIRINYLKNDNGLSGAIPNVPVMY